MGHYGGFSGFGLVPLVSVQGTLNGSAYQDTLDNFMFQTPSLGLACFCSNITAHQFTKQGPREPSDCDPSLILLCTAQFLPPLKKKGVGAAGLDSETLSNVPLVDEWELNRSVRYQMGL